MSFDPTLKDLLESGATEWLEWLGLPVAPCRWIDADVSAVSAHADKVLRVSADPVPWLLHLELQSDHDLTLVPRMQQYHALLQARHGEPAHSVAVLLRRQAQASNLTGELRTAAPGGPETVFRYTVVRLWQQPTEQMLTGGLGLLPLAPLTGVSAADLPAIVRRIGDRLDTETGPGERAKLWAATYILMGLSWKQGVIDHVLRGVRAMKSSVTYQAILAEGRDEGREEGREEGRAEEARSLILRQGRKKFGRPPTKRQAAELAAVADRARLEVLAERILDAASWGELLAAGSAEP
ncbi:MAG: hypothetical protein ACRC7O_00160 [Fimbriiglobus sp.]